MIFRSMCKDCKLHPNINVQLARSACVQSTNRHDVTLFVSPKYLSPVGVQNVLSVSSLPFKSCLAEPA